MQDFLSVDHITNFRHLAGPHEKFSFLTQTVGLGRLGFSCMMGKNQSVGKGHTKWLGGPGCGPWAACCIPLQYYKNDQFENYSRIFKDASKYSRTTRCFSRIKDKTGFDSKFKDNSWRSRTFGNLSVVQCSSRVQQI